MKSWIRQAFEACVERDGFASQEARACCLRGCLPTCFLKRTGTIDVDIRSHISFNVRRQVVFLFVFGGDIAQERGAYSKAPDFGSLWTI